VKRGRKCQTYADISSCSCAPGSFQKTREGEGLWCSQRRHVQKKSLVLSREKEFVLGGGRRKLGDGEPPVRIALKLCCAGKKIGLYFTREGRAPCYFVRQKKKVDKVRRNKKENNQQSHIAFYLQIGSRCMSGRKGGGITHEGTGHELPLYLSGKDTSGGKKATVLISQKEEGTFITESKKY